MKAFNLSQPRRRFQHKHEDCGRENSPKFDTRIDKLTKFEKWPSPPAKRRSKSANFENYSQKEIEEGYRVTFTNKPGGMIMKTVDRGDTESSKHMPTIVESSFDKHHLSLYGSRHNSPQRRVLKPFVLKKPVSFGR